jgi:hypothetical protein
MSKSKQSGGRRHLPYVFTEQGIAMLSGLLKNETAVQVSIGIMDALVDMRRFIAAYGGMFERLTKVEYKLLKHDETFDEIFDLIQSSELPKQGVFFKGQVYDSFSMIVDIIKSASQTITIIDNYVDDSILKMLAKKSAGVKVVILSGISERIDSLDIEKFNKQFRSIEVIKSREFHDRFMIIDDTTVYHIGASLKDLGKQCFALSQIEEPELFLNGLKRIMQEAMVS